MTLREVVREFVGAKRRLKREHQRDRALAWYGEVLHRQKTIPEFDAWLGRQPRPQTSEEKRAALTLIFGNRPKAKTRA